MKRRVLALGLCACVLAAVTTGCLKKTSMSDALQERADEAIAEAAPGAYLTSAGTGGLALSDDPHQWSYLYYDPDTTHLWQVFVHEGEAPELTDLGEAKATVGERVPQKDVIYSASEAIEIAREEAANSGLMLPRNVQASGSYAEIEGGEALGLKRGVWRVTFATDASMNDALTYEVDMRDGAVTGPLEDE